MEKLIYLIEDDRLMRFTLEKHIRKLKNVRLIIFDDPFELIKASINHPPEILLLDFKIRSKNRNFLADEIIYHLNRVDAQIPTVVFSGLNSKILEMNLLKQGVFEYISKNEDDFLNKIKQSILNILDWIKKTKTRELIKINHWQYN